MTAMELFVYLSPVLVAAIGYAYYRHTKASTARMQRLVDGHHHPAE